MNMIKSIPAMRLEGPRRLRRLLLGVLVAAGPAALSLVAQTEAPTKTEQSIVLPVFEVTSERSNSYSSSYSVGATRMSLALNEIPQNIAVINEKLIRDVRPDALSEVTKYVAGVTESVGPARDVFMIRGVSIGSPFTDGLPEVGSSQGFALDMNLFNRIEVLKGPTAVIYGSTASGGVVNRVTKKPQFDRASGLIDLQAGSFEQYRASIDFNQPFGEHSQFAVRLIGSYWDQQGEQDFSYKRRRFLAPMFGWRIGANTTATVQVTDYHDKYYKGWGQIFTLPPYVGNNLQLSLGLDLPRERAYAEPYSTQWEEGRRYAFFLDHRVSDAWSLRFSGATSTYTYVEDPTTILRDLVVQNGRYYMQRSWRQSDNPNDATTLALDSAWKFDVGPTKHNLLALVQYQKGESGVVQYLGRSASGSTTNVLPLLDIMNPVYGGQPASTFLSTQTESEGTNFGAAVQEQAYFFDEKLILQASVRYNRNTSEGYNVLTNVRNTPPTSSKWTPRYGIVYRPLRGVSAYASRSETFTPVFTTNPDGTTFTPPTSEQNEIGLKFDILEGKISATVAYYERTDENTIVNDPDPIRASAGYRIQKAGDKMDGYEIDLYLTPIPSVQLLLAGSKMDPKNLSGLLTSNVPEDQASAYARYEIQKGALKGLAFGVGYIYRGRRPGDTGNTFWLPAYDVFDGFASYTHGKYSYNLKVENLGDEYYAHAAVNRNVINAGVPRTITLRASRQF